MSLKTLLRIIKEHNLFPPQTTVVTAVSGGTDSLALLHMLHSLQDDLRITLHVATFDHGLRHDSADDVRFVCQVAAELELPATTGKVDVAAAARVRSQGLELAARQARYTFLAGVARQIGADRVAVGHNACDQAETILMHILRGTGMQGLQGMRFTASVPGAPDLTLVRPLLAFPRATLTAYCQHHNLHPRQDASNTDEQYSRNYIRHKVLPFLKSVNPSVEHALIRLADITAVDQDYLELEYARCVLPHIRREQGRVCIDREVFRRTHLALQRRFVHRTALELGYEGFGQVHILHAVKIGLHGDVGAVAQLPNRLQMRVDYDSLVFEETNAPAPASAYHLLFDETTAIPVAIPGITTVPNTGWSLQAGVGEHAGASVRILILPGSNVLLRSRRSGDRFAPIGMCGKSQSVKKWMINRKIPRYLRNRIPLLVVADEIAAILIGDQWAISETAAPTQQDTTVSVVSVSIIG